MRKILALVGRDFAHVKDNAVALLVCMGLIIIPSFYAWFNIAGGWDPYGNTENVKVALATMDEGITGTLLPAHVNVGERVVTELAKSTKIGYVVTTADDAIDGVRSGRYYAAAVIPKNFSSNLLSVFTRNPTHPTLEFYINEKRNPIAAIVTGKASTSIQDLVNTGFTEAVTEVATEIFDELQMTLDDEGVLSVATGIDDALDVLCQTLRRTSSDLIAYKAVAASVRSVMETGSAILGEGSSSLEAASMLSETAQGVRQFDEAQTTAKGAATEAATTASQAATDLETAVDDAFATADGKADELASALTRVGDVARARRDDMQRLYDALESLNGEIYSFDKSFGLGGLEVEYVHSIESDISDLLSRTSNAIGRLDDLIATNDQSISDLVTARTNATTTHAELKNQAALARASIDEVRTTYDGDFTISLASIASALDDAAAKAQTLSGTLTQETGRMSDDLVATADDIQALEDTLGEVATKITETAESLEGLHDKLSLAVSTGDLDLVRTVMGAGAASLEDFISSPVVLDREPVYPVENNGSAMTPFYTTMALWVGGTLMGILLYTAISKEAQDETQARPRHAYFGRLAFFLIIGCLQATALLLGDLYLLGVQCDNVALFLATGYIASFVFINIIYALSTAFGDVGKAIAVFIMVVQVAGSGGTFPVQMLPAPFQAAYPYLPFVHSENAFRAAMFGVTNGDWAHEASILLMYLIPALVLGLLLRKPFIRLNEWVEEKMEETKLM